MRFFRPIGATDTPQPKKTTQSKGGKKLIKYERWRAKTLAECNVRSDASTKSAIVDYYDKGRVIYYDSVYEGDCYRWISYVSWSGVRRYVAYRRLSGDTKPWMIF